ncbi:MAG TPA: alpha/beta hydrolase-fold protein [Bryobacteraceae bacterium]|nr:alpha/beta hydrolase-fold protein [Bryobacteraceae bacterium]
MKTSPIFVALTLASLALAQSRVEDREIASKNFADNKIGVSPIRKLAVFLPSGYEQTSKRYPVIYFLPSTFENYRAPFSQHDAQALFDHAIESGSIHPFILVAVDMNTPLGCSWYVNSSVTGNWEDFVIQELVPYMDANFRSMPNRDSRGIAGDFMGGYGAIRFGMRHPDVFGSVYALHPVGTGSGVQVMYSRPNWDLLASAKSLDDIRKDVFSNIFMSIFQAHVPNPAKPPLFIDFQAHKNGDRLDIDSKITERLRNNFFIESMIPQYADNLKSLRGLKFDWARNDGNYDHIYANQALTHKLDEFGIPHEAEEYNGLWGHGVWGDDGRMHNEVLPFFGKHLVFESDSSR